MSGGVAVFLLAEATTRVGSISGILGLYSIATGCDDTYRREVADNQEIWTLILLFHCSDNKDTIIQCAKIANYSILPNFSGIFLKKNRRKEAEKATKWRNRFIFCRVCLRKNKNPRARTARGLKGGLRGLRGKALCLSDRLLSDGAVDLYLVEETGREEVDE